MEVTAFTDMEALAGYAKEAEPDFLLLADGIDPEMSQIPETVRIIRIRDEKDPSGDKDSVCRFQSRDSLKADILDACFLSAKGRPDVNDRVREAGRELL